MYNQFGVKELYEASLKTTDSMTINGQQYEPDEVVMFFDTLQIANISAESVVKEASGGRNDFSWIVWDTVKSVSFVFEDGLLNFNGFNLNGQSRYGNSGANMVTIPRREIITADSAGDIVLEYTPKTTRSIFAYKTTSAIIVSKLSIVSVSGKTVSLGVANAYSDILIDYYFEDDNITYYELGGENIQGFFKLTAKLNVTDVNGGRTTMLMVLPKVKIMSNINLTLGVRANPIVSTFRLQALPMEDGKTLARFIYLNQDIEG